jgi:hypothetical protein
MTPIIENVSLVREESRPEIYFVCSNTKFWIPQAEFNAMGFRGDKGQIVPDGTLTSSTPGMLDPFPSKPFVNPRSSVKPSDVHFSPPGPQDVEGLGKWYGNCKPAASIIKRNIMIAGWLESDPIPNGNQQGLEDMLYDVLLDPDFIDRMYGNDGLSNALAGWRLPGNPPVAPERQLPVADLDMDGNSRGVTLNSFTLPGTLVPVKIHCEQNAWHVESTEVLFRVNWIGRGAPPQGWMRRPFSGVDGNGQPFSGKEDTWWPYNPVNPENSPSGNLRKGDYVLMKGTFWVDTSHGPGSWTITHPGYDGWLELHPIDWMVRLEPPPPHRRKTTALIDVAPDEGGTTSRSEIISLDPNVVGNPIVPGKELKVHTCRALVDGRFTFPDTVVRHDVRIVDEHTGQPLDHVNCDIEVGSGGPGQPGRFKAVYIVTWQGQQTSNAAFVSQSVPSPMRATQQREVSVTMKNTGPTTWSPGGANPFRLGSQNPQDNSVWGTGRVDVPAEVAPGDEATFRFAVIAPTSMGSYSFQWRMVQEAVEWFGDFTPNLTVEVISKGTLNVWMEPSRPRVGMPAIYTVRATDAESGLDVHGGKVGITNPSAATQVFDVNTPFTFTFRTQRILVDPGPPREFEILEPTVAVTAPGYGFVLLDFG